MYAYTQNNPVMRIDPSGYLPEWIQDVYNWYYGLGIYGGVMGTAMAPAAVVGAVATGVSIGFAASEFIVGMSWWWSIKQRENYARVNTSCDLSSLSLDEMKVFISVEAQQAVNRQNLQASGISNGFAVGWNLFWAMVENTTGLQVFGDDIIKTGYINSDLMLGEIEELAVIYLNENNVPSEYFYELKAYYIEEYLKYNGR